METSIVIPDFVDARIGPRGSLENLSQAEIEKLLDSRAGGLYPLFRKCALAVMNSGSESDNAKEIFDRYKERFNAEPNIGAVYGYVAADVTVLGLGLAGPNLSLDSFINGLESIRNYHDIFHGPELNYGPDKHQGANSSFLAVVKGGRWVRVTEPLSF